MRLGLSAPGAVGSLSPRQQEVGRATFARCPKNRTLSLESSNGESAGVYLARVRARANPETFFRGLVDFQTQRSGSQCRYCCRALRLGTSVRVASNELEIIVFSASTSVRAHRASRGLRGESSKNRAPWCPGFGLAGQQVSEPRERARRQDPTSLPRSFP